MGFNSAFKGLMQNNQLYYEHSRLSKITYILINTVYSRN